MYMRIASSLPLPKNSVTQKLAFLGVSGSGKTYGAGKFVEELLSNGDQVIVVDTIGNWWGLRLDANGKPDDGAEIPILGGLKADVALAPTAGELVADTVASTRDSLILDVSDFTGGELRRFVTAFATRLLRAKKSNPSPVMIVWEECQGIVPQRVMRDAAQMVGAVEALIKKGRNYGIGTTLISQRPQAVNKDVLNQCETLFVFRTVGKQERKAIEEWVVHQDVDVEEALRELPSLKTGTCFVWSPAWLQIFEKVVIAPKVTFDASATPEWNGKSKQHKLPPVDLDALKATMADAIKDVQENNLDALKKRVALAEEKVTKLEAQLLSKIESNNERGRLVHEAIEKHLVRAEKLSEKLQKPLGDVALHLTDLTNQIVAARRPALHSSIGSPAHQAVMADVQKVVQKTYGGGDYVVTKNGEVKRHSVARTVEDKYGLSKCAREIVAALGNRYPTPLTRRQIATLSCYSPKSSTFANGMSECNVAGLIEKQGDVYTLTEAGKQNAPALGGDASPAALLDLWARKLPTKCGQMLQLLATTYYNGLDRDGLAGAIELSPTSSTFANYLSALNSNGLIVKQGGVIKAAPEFLS